MRFEPRSWLLAAGQSQFDLSVTSANDFRILPRTGGTVTIQEDYEVERAALVWRKGLRGGAEASVEIPLMSRGGGFLDNVINWWHHHVLKWSDPQRDSTPVGQSIIRIPGSSFGSAAGVGDISFSMAKRLDPRFTLTAGLKLPTGDAKRLLGSGGMDAGLYVQSQLPINRRWTLHGQLGFVAQGRSTSLRRARGLVHQEGLSLVYQPNTQDAFIAQWQGEASPTVTGEPGADATHRLITFGYERRLSPNQTITGFFSEDRDLFSGHFPEGANIGPDFTVGLRWTLKY